MPWRYDTTVYMDGKEIQFSDVEIVNIAGIGGMTHSGRVFDPKYTPKVVSSPIIISHSEKLVLSLPLKEGASVPTTPVVTTVPPMTQGTTSKVTEVETSKGKEMVNE